MPNMSWNSLLNAPAGGAGAPLASSTTLTDISILPQLTIPANFLQVGSAIRLTAFGLFSTTVTPTLLLGFYYGTTTGVSGVALAASAATATGSGVTNVPWRMEYTGIVRTVGASGTIMGQGFLHLGTTVALVNTSPLPVIALATVTIDTTVAKVITAGAQWGTNNAANTITCHGMFVESMA